MAASVFCSRTSMLCRSLRGLSCGKNVLSASSRSCVLLQTASYNPRPLKLNLREPYIPDKDSPKTPEWQKTVRYDAKLFGRYGSASGVDPATLWPSDEELERIIEDEKQWQPPLETMQRDIEARERAEAKKRLEKEKLIAANMAKMPQMIADWRREKREAKQKMKEEKARRAKLLVEARERFGFAVDHRSPKFLQMVAELEKEEKKKKKLLKRRLREEQAAAPTVAPPVTPPAASS
ncbi:growth arrest and DNA damage-inducible proteins-interacting protein 1 [Plectropomus leopardus]|uniref:growth arrest and DNA damage-inducible proteins-interacting protein 1 n=1 Tax=Plectropomus leopardus TaxID=160734 RepID=UPI001C4D430C|nr:growth arrest and DNA damage-inducible proteins-interacting protein 1 [Plectropomus leopardus]